LNTIPQPQQSLFESEPDSSPMPTTTSSNDRENIYNLLSTTAIETDDIIRESGMSAPQVSGILLELELSGRAQRQPGGRVSRL
jgi:DNA processing protein